MVLRIVLICHTQWHVLLLRVVAQNVIALASTDSNSPHVLSIYAAVSHCSRLSGLKASGWRARQQNRRLTMKAEMLTAKRPKAICCPLGRFCFLSCHFPDSLPKTLFWEINLASYWIISALYCKITIPRKVNLLGQV